MICASKKAVQDWIRENFRKHLIEDKCGPLDLDNWKRILAINPNIPEYARWN